MNDDAILTPPAAPEILATAPPVAPIDPNAPAAEAPAPAPPSAPITPYRTAPEAPAAFAAPRRASLLGATVFVFGVLLWAFVVMGELTTSYAPGKHSMLVGEALAVVFVLGTSAVAWRAAMLRNLALKPAESPALAYTRSGVVAVGAIVLCWIVVVLATGMGKAASKDMDGPISLMLLVLSTAAGLGGRRLASLHGPAATPRGRTIARVLWAVATVLTLVALVEIASS
jgi:hypothetical protein